MSGTEDVGYNQTSELDNAVKSLGAPHGSLYCCACGLDDFFEVGIDWCLRRTHGPKLLIRGLRHVVIQMAGSLQFQRVVEHRSVDDVQCAVILATQTCLVDVSPHGRVTVSPMQFFWKILAPILEPIHQNGAQVVILRDLCQVLAYKGGSARVTDVCMSCMGTWWVNILLSCVEQVPKMQLIRVKDHHLTSTRSILWRLRIFVKVAMRILDSRDVSNATGREIDFRKYVTEI